MKTLRINLHIRSDVSPKLYQTLVAIPPRPRAEFLRRVSEMGLQASENSRFSPGNPVAIAQTVHNEDAAGVGSARQNFGDDIANVVGSGFLGGD